MIVTLMGLILTLGGMGASRLTPRATAADPPSTDTPEAATARAGPATRTRPLSDEAVDSAVAAGLKWVVRQQHADGHWSLDLSYGHRDIAATALGLLPLVRAGHGPKSEGTRRSYAKHVEMGLKYLLSEQKEDGSFDDYLYSHALATIAIGEAYSRTGEVVYGRALQPAVDVIAKSQTAMGGWSYLAKARSGRGDMSNTGWQIQALIVGERAGARVPKEIWIKLSRYLDSVASPGGRYGYAAPQPGSSAMTAAALLGRRYLGWETDHPDFVKAIAFLEAHPPNISREGC
jgi:hypothetical protein